LQAAVAHSLFVYPFFANRNLRVAILIVSILGQIISFEPEQ